MFLFSSFLYVMFLICEFSYGRLRQAIQERHENSLLKTEMDKLRDENKSLRETIKKSACPNCGFATSSKDASVATEEQQLKIENARLKAEV